MINNLEDFKTKFTEIRNQGWIKTCRSGPTGIGKTLEERLGIKENNLDGPDFANYELKSARINSTSMLTLFTRTPEPAKANNYLRLTYGYSSSAYDNDEKVLHATLTASKFVNISNTGHKLKIVCDEKKIYLESENGAEEVWWTHENLRKAFEKKYPKTLIYVKAESRNNGKNEEFKYIMAHELSDFNYDSMIALLQNGKIFIDLRIGQYPDGRTHDHGTGFRIREADQDSLFKTSRNLLI
jgi:hypothetical protein